MLAGTQKRIPFLGLDGSDNAATDQLSPARRDLPSEKGFTWYPLRYLQLFRTLLALLLIVVSVIPNLIGSLSVEQVELFRHTSQVYVLVAVASFALALLEKPTFAVQVTIQQLTDVLILGTLIFASGGVDSGIATLLVITVTFGGLLLPGVMAFFFAALATVSILLQQLYWSSDNGAALSDFSYAGFLGLTCFVSAGLAQFLAMRVRAQTTLAHRTESELNQLAQLNHHIIRNMQTGILVVDQNNRVVLGNESAGKLLGIGTLKPGLSLSAQTTVLDQTLARWHQQHGAMRHADEPEMSSNDSFLPKFSKIDFDNTAATVIFLEDAAALRQQVQMQKMASMGRLTGSIAHEIRNPLSAVSHAAELLKESENRDPEDERLIQIILKHTRRAKKITEDVLDLGKPRTTRPHQFSLEPWLKHFVWTFTQQNNLSEEAIKIDVPTALEVRMDRGQLEQVLWNLIKNALEHSTADANPRVELIGQVNPKTARPTLNVVDHGTGIATENCEKVFEPFFSTRSLGTGLGLYVSRELCEANQARLEIVDRPKHTDGTCFRITFMDPRRQQTL